jgi:glycosyltransferase involved in cell wall biosynthesis
MKHKLFDVSSDVLPIAPKGVMLSEADDWPGIECIYPVELRRRGDFDSLTEVFKVVRKNHSEVIICHTHRHILSVWLAQIFSRRRSRIILAEHQAISLRTPFDDVWSLVGIFFSRVVVVLTPNYAEQYRWRFVTKLLKKNLIVIPNGIEISAIDLSTHLEGNEVITVGMAARLVASKDLSTVVKAIKLLNQNKNSPRYRLLIAGDGPFRMQLENEVADLGLDSQISFLGQLKRPELSSFYRSLDIYVHSSQGETLCMAILEAASHALPIIGSNVDGIRDVLDANSIHIFNLADPEDLASKIKELEDSSVARILGDNARSLVSQKYDSKTVSQIYLRTIENLL